MSGRTGSRAQQLLDGCVELASPPAIYGKLMKVLDDPRTGSADLATVISEDQGLTARILAVVNSALFSLPWKVDSIAAAVRLVGTTQVRDLAVGTSVLSLFSGVPDDLLDVESLRYHSLACGVTSRTIASMRGEENVERFFVAGLLHDIGRLVIIHKAAEGMRDALEKSRSGKVDMSPCEREIIGCNHAQVGEALLDRWQFPPSLREAVRFHHEPRRARRFPVEAASTHVADIIAHAFDWGRSGQPHVPEFDPEAWALLGLEGDAVPVIAEEAERHLEAAAHLVAEPAVAA